MSASGPPSPLKCFQPPASTSRKRSAAHQNRIAAKANARLAPSDASCARKIESMRRILSWLVAGRLVETQRDRRLGQAGQDRHQVGDHLIDLAGHVLLAALEAMDVLAQIVAA